MANELQELFTTIWTFIAGHYQWVIGVILLPIILFWLSQRGKKIIVEEHLLEADEDDVDDKITHRKQIELQERMVEAYENDVYNSIAHRSFIQNVIKGALTLGFLAWLFGDDKK
ncbi:hypothetical protein ACFL5M_04195 [Candidatus Neomarinimicrobiota bacterium]